MYQFHHHDISIDTDACDVFVGERRYDAEQIAEHVSRYFLPYDVRDSTDSEGVRSVTIAHRLMPSVTFRCVPRGEP